MMQGFEFKGKFNTAMREDALLTIQADPLGRRTEKLEGSDTDTPAKRACSSTVGNRKLLISICVKSTG